MDEGYILPSDKSWIKCKHCGFVSHNVFDVRERYCSRCHVFHDDAAKVRTLDHEIDAR